MRATKDAARPAEVTRKLRRLILSRSGTDSRASSTRASTCFCLGVCRNGGKYSSFDTSCVGIGNPNGSTSAAGLHLSGAPDRGARHRQDPAGRRIGPRIHGHGPPCSPADARRAWASPTSPSSRPWATRRHTPAEALPGRLGRWRRAGPPRSRVAARFPTWPRRCGPIPRPSATGSSTPWPPGWHAVEDGRSCSCSTTCTGPPSRPCCCCAMWCGPAEGGSSSLGALSGHRVGHDHPLVEVVADLRRHRRAWSECPWPASTTWPGSALIEQAAGRCARRATGSPWPGSSTGRDRRATRSSSGRCSATWPRRAPSSGRTAAGPPSSPSTSWAFPEGVREVVGRRLARLSGETNEALRSPPWSGRSSTSGVVQAAGDLSEETLLAAVEEAVGARLVDRGLGHPVPLRPRPGPGDAVRVAHRRPAGHVPPQGGRGHRGDPPGAPLDDYVPALAHHWAKASAPVPTSPRAVELRPASRRPGPRRAGPRRGRRATTPPASTCSTPVAPIRRSPRLELLIGRGEAQRRPAIPATARRCSTPRAWPSRLGDAHALARAALANTLGYMWTGLCRRHRPDRGARSRPRGRW